MLYLYEKEQTKAPVFIENYIYQKELVEGKIRNIMKDKNKRDSLVHFTASFINDHSKELSTSGPVYTFTFAEKETNFLYNLIGTNEDHILSLFNKVIDETYMGKLSLPLAGLIKKAPHKILITGILVDAIQMNYQEVPKCCEYIMGFADYPMVFRSSWKLGVNEQTMTYTIEHLPNKFKIKARQIYSVLGLIEYDMNKVRVLCEDRLKGGADNVYIDYIYRVRNQMKNTYQKIAEQYYKNQKNQSTQHTTTDMTDEGMIVDQDNGISTTISNITENTLSKFIKGDINGRILETIAATKDEISENILRAYITKIVSSKNNRLSEFIENLITLFFLKYPEEYELRPKFLNFSIVAYNSINRSTERLNMEIAKILNFWVDDICAIKKDYKRSATIINYKVAIYRYFVAMINHYN